MNTPQQPTSISAHLDDSAESWSRIARITMKVDRIIEKQEHGTPPPPRREINGIRTVK